jgi:hypothetical protein
MMWQTKLSVQTDRRIKPALHPVKHRGAVVEVYPRKYTTSSATLAKGCEETFRSLVWSTKDKPQPLLYEAS